MTRSYRFWLMTLVLASGLTLLMPIAGDRFHRRTFDAPAAAAQFYEARRMPLRGGLNTAALYAAALDLLARLPHFSSRIDRALPAGRTSAASLLDAWTPLGPGNIGGRTRVVRYHPTLPHVIFAAGVSGGIWKSDDNGTTWRSIGADLANIAINSLVIRPDQPDVMFAGLPLGQRSRARRRRQPAHLRRNSNGRVAVAGQRRLVDAAARDARSRRLSRSRHASRSGRGCAVRIVWLVRTSHRLSARASEHQRSGRGGAE